MFKRAWDKFFTEENIQLAFRKSSIWPTNGSNIIKKITHPTLTSPQKTNGLRSPKSAKAIRHFQIVYEKEPTIDKVKKVFSTAVISGVRLVNRTGAALGIYMVLGVFREF